jgi:O-acetyl-ADP-ribose deacetylase (regulator of RNase III)
MNPKDYPQYPNLRYVTGDLLQSYKDGITVIGHQCNCRGGWNAGIHGQIGKRWPTVIESYRSVPWQLGHCRIFKTGLPNFSIAYLAGQDDYGNALRTGRVYTQYDALLTALPTLASAIQPEDKIAFPLIGAGLAGGDWSIIAQMISETFLDRETTIYIYK